MACRDGFQDRDLCLNKDGQSSSLSRKDAVFLHSPCPVKMASAYRAPVSTDHHDNPFSDSVSLLLCDFTVLAVRLDTPSRWTLWTVTASCKKRCHAPFFFVKPLEMINSDTKYVIVDRMQWLCFVIVQHSDETAISDSQLTW